MIKYNITNKSNTSIYSPSNKEGETIETKIQRIVNNNEPITDGAPLIYQERKDGVQPDYDVRTDRFDVAIEAMDVVSKSKLAKREEKAKTQGTTEKIQGTEQAEKPA